LVEKYRPQQLQDIVGLNLNNFVIDENLQHLLFYGPPGTEKLPWQK